MYHPVGTAALGEVLDSRLRVHGVQVITLRLTLTQKSKNKWVLEGSNAEADTDAGADVTRAESNVAAAAVVSATVATLLILQQELRKMSIVLMLMFHQGLRVADGSAMPLLVGGNTQAAVIMIGEKAAAMIIEEAINLSKAVRTELRRDEL